MDLLTYMDAVQSLETAPLACEASKALCADKIKKMKKEISALERKRENETEKQKEILKKERNLQREAESKFVYPVNRNEQGVWNEFISTGILVTIFAFIPVLIATFIVFYLMKDFGGGAGGIGIVRNGTSGKKGAKGV